jgi:nucleoside-diphosphate-sugar epimerase
MKIFITGTSGFIGQHLVPLLQAKHEVVELKSDLRDHSDVTRELEQADPDVIVHLAARTEVEKSFYEQVTFSEINYVGSVNLIDAASRLRNLKNFVFASTMEVYGWQPISDEVEQFGQPKQAIAFDEHTAPNPNAPYAVAKLAVEKYLEYSHRALDLPFTAIRQTNSYGRSDNDFFVTEQIITQMLKNPERIKLGYAEPYRNFIYIQDLLQAWLTVIENPEQCNQGKIYTIGPDSPIKIKDYANKIANMIGWQGEIQWNTKPMRPGEIYWLNSGTAAISRDLGWTPVVDLETGLDRTIALWQKKIIT